MPSGLVLTQHSPFLAFWEFQIDNHTIGDIPYLQMPSNPERQSENGSFSGYLCFGDRLLHPIDCRLTLNHYHSTLSMKDTPYRMNGSLGQLQLVATLYYVLRHFLSFRHCSPKSVGTPFSLAEIPFPRLRSCLLAAVVSPTLMSATSFQW